MNQDNVQKQTWVGGFLLAVFPILAQYFLPVMSYGFVLILLYFFIKLFDGNAKLCFNKPLLGFVLFSLAQQLFVYAVSGTFEVNRSTYFFMLVCLFILASANRIEKQSYMKCYFVISMICCVAVLYQAAMGFIFGVPQSAIQILPVSMEDQHFWMTNRTRASGFFTEPQAFGSYLLPLLIHLIFEKRFKSAVFVSISIFASTSSQGIILSFVIWMIYLFKYQRDIAKKIVAAMGICSLMIIVMFIFRNVGIFKFAIDKILSIDIFSYNIRLTKGFEIYHTMPIKDKIFGIGDGNLKNYLLNGNFHFFWLTLTQSQLIGYITTMSNVLVSYGVIGFVLYLYIFIVNKNTCSLQAKTMLLLIFIASFTQTILFNAWFVLYWMVFELFDEPDSGRYKIVYLSSKPNVRT